MCVCVYTHIHTLSVVRKEGPYDFFLWRYNRNYSEHVHLGCFHVLSIVNRAAVNMQVHVYFLRKILSG